MARFFNEKKDLQMANSKFLLKCLPVGNLPYEDVSLTIKMMLKLYESLPYLAFLPKISNTDNVIDVTLTNLSGVVSKEKRYYLTNNIEKFKQISLYLDSIYNAPTVEKLELFEIDTIFMQKYLQILNRIKPAETVVNLLGPFSMSQILFHKSGVQILADRIYRKFIIQSIVARALWLISEVKAVSPKTKPIIILEEPLLYRLGDVKRNNEEITKDVIVNLFAKVIQKIKEYHGLVGIQCFEKCDWQIPIEAGVDIISFDAYNNPNNLTIIAEKINDFLVGGGRINWAIVPVMTEALVKSLTIDQVYSRFVNTVENLVVAGVSERLVYNRAMVSINGNIDKLPLIFAEKALMLALQLSKRIPVKS